jgi:hypothetical protein
MGITVLSLGLTIALLTACAPAHVVHTPAPTPVAGARVRYAVRPDTTDFVTVRLLALDADSLVFERFIPGEPQGRWVIAAVATDSVARLQVHVGRRGNAGRGAAFGFLVGGALGLACASEGDSWVVTSEQCLVGYALLGSGTGLLIGALRRSDVWAPTALPARPPALPPAPPITASAAIEVPPVPPW